MKVYFTASVLQKDQYGIYYDQIVSILEKLGHKVIHEHVTKMDMDSVKKQTFQQNADHYKKVQKQINSSDFVVAEVTFPSTLNIGHEVTQALSKGKPVICLYMQGKASYFFNGIKDDKLIYEEYLPENLESVLTNCLERLEEVADTRFNFYISPEIGNYLDWVNQNKKIPRAVFLRSLLEKAMKADKEFES